MKPLTPLQSDWLQGRAADIEEIVANCAAERMTVVTAEPGAGITSLLLAGLKPALEAQGFIPVHFSSWQGRYFGMEFKEAIAQAVREHADPNFYSEAELLFEMLDRVKLRTGRIVVLLLDDFHDYLRAHSNTDVSDSFDAEISQVLSGREGRTVVGIQENWLPLFERLRPQVPNLLSYRHPLPLLSAEAAVQMLRIRAQASGLEVDDDAAGLLLTPPLVTRVAGVNPFYLAVLLEQVKTFELRLKARSIRAATITANGGAEAILNEAFDNPIEELGKSHKELFFRLCNLLVTPGKVRATVSEKELQEYSGSMNRFLMTLIPRASEVSLLRPFDVNNIQHYEFPRACQAPLIRDWWERTEAKIVARRRANFRVTSISVAVGAIVLAYLLFQLWPSGK